LYSLNLFYRRRVLATCLSDARIRNYAVGFAARFYLTLDVDIVVSAAGRRARRPRSLSRYLELMNKKPTLEINLQEFYETLRFVSESLTGDYGVQELEKQVKSLSETTPFLTNILAAIGEAQRRMDVIRDMPPQVLEDPEISKQFINHNETYCCLQGSLATLMIVTQTIQKQSTPKPRTRKKRLT
jgi:hypothetical protein